MNFKMTKSKLLRLDAILKELKSFIVAFSGGVDSSFLLHRAHSIGNLKILAVTVRTPYIPSWEISEALEFTDTYGINHKIIDLEIPEIIKHNPVERCYLCKKILFKKITETAKENGYKYVLDGTNADDTSDYRPGLRALKEMGVRSPLSEAGLTKRDIRDQLKDDGITLWDKPSMACLLTRIPYDTEINPEMLRMIEEAEFFLFNKGYPGTRVRVHGDVARIECLPGYLEKIIKDPGKELIVSGFKKIGFRYISLDLEGYRSGSMDPDTKEL